MFPSNDSSGHVWCSSDRPSQNFQPEVGKISAQNRIGNVEVVQNFFLKKFLWKYWKQTRQTWRCYNFKNPKSLARIEKTTTIYFFSKPLVFPKWFLSTRTIQFRQTCFTFLAGIWKVFCSNLTKRKNFFNILSLKYSCGELEFSFDNHADVFPQKQQKLSVQCPKTEKNTISLLEKSWFLQMASLGTYKAVPSDSLQFLADSWNFFCSDSLKKPEKISFFLHEIPPEK